MFVGRLERTVAAGCERWAVDRLRVMTHPLLEHFRWEGPDLSVLLCRERSTTGGAGLPPASGAGEAELRAFLTIMEAWPLDWQAIVVDHRRAAVTVRAGHGGVAPLYVRPSASAIEVSWDFADFYADAAAGDVDPAWTAFRLTGNPPYAAATLFSNVFMVTERAALHVDVGGKVTVEYPAPAPYFLPTPVREDVDIPAVASDLVEALLRRWPLDALEVAAEFSGGMDSAVIAGVLARGAALPPVTAALEITGAAAFQQRERRELAIARLGYRDMTWPVERTAMVPSGFSAASDYVATPRNADLQRPLRGLIAALVRERGTRVIATGTGGDELHMLHAFEQDAEQWARNVSDAYLPQSPASAIRPTYRNSFGDYARRCERAPFPVLPISVLEAQAARAPLFAENGLWPVSAFAQPESVRFYRSLPREWRAGKALHRRMLSHLGYPDAFLDVPLRENFETYLTTSLVAAAGGITRDLRRECRLHDLGIVDADALIHAVSGIGSASGLDEVGFVFHAFNVETILRRVGTRRQGGWDRRATGSGDVGSTAA
ncbi:asparagine synthase [Ciceribacter lividus]|uniref:Asparagine synthase n=1 Tax=Ciceribacter lividus TaxID=1197950 RepID=A0A6I7HIF7_9HYPH|nr:asparagine synthase-related protein [Ciceribacter lividus]RCW21521.1 asparagine synthase [Ciceribacter lividus]